jgi:hypothetical protein
MNQREKLIKNIIENYNKKNSNNPEKIYLEKPAKDNKDPFFIEFKKEINKSIYTKEKKKHKKSNKEIDNEDFKNELENNSENVLNNDRLDKDIIDKIKIKTKEILKVITINLFLYKKDKLQEMIFNIIIKDYNDINLTDIKKEKIGNLISILIEHEMISYFSNDDKHENSELLKYFLKKIYPEIIHFYNKNEYEKINKLSIAQKKFFINSFVEYLERKYLKKEINKNNISQEEYNFLKSKINVFIAKQEKNFKEISLLKREFKKIENI